MRAAPSDSILPTFFRWCLGGMAAFTSGSGSASARDADPSERVTRLLKEVDLECGDISPSQEDRLARAPFLPDSLAVDPLERCTVKKVQLDCGDISASQEDLLARGPFLGGGEEEEEAEEFSTPPLTQGQQGQREGEEEDVITMSSLPFSQPPPSSRIDSSPEDNEDQPRPQKPQKPRVCIRKVRGARIRTPTPSPPTPSPSLGPSPEKGSASTSSTVDPLTRAVLMIPTAPPPGADEDILVLARRAGIF